jgi:formylglycine-generating enzyme required for sulfatase activity
VAPSGAGDDDEEGREWLPKLLLGVFGLVMVAIVVFLLSDDTGWKVPWPATTDQETVTGTQEEARGTGPTSEETARWRAALDADTALAYQRFLADYPGSFYAGQAQTQLEILDQKAWEALAAEDTVPAYEDYLEQFPNGIHQAEALVRIDEIRAEEARLERERLELEKRELADWEAARASGTIEGFDHYIATWPGGAHIEDAHRLRRLLVDLSNDEDAFQSALSLNTRDAFQSYIDAFPSGVHVADALRHIDDLTLRPGKTFRDCEDCPLMVVVPALTYWQGSDDASQSALGMEKPRRQVTIQKPFAVGVYEGTMVEWDRCVADQGCSAQPPDNGWGRGDRPVMMVSWNEAGEYVNWLSESTGQNYRLPSESEWEYFARAGETGDWPAGDPAIVCEFGNIAGNETGFRWRHTLCDDAHVMGTSRVGSYRPNAYGLYDTVGNVSEWTADCMNLSYLDAPVDGSAWGRGICSSHMTRGGSWVTGTKEIRLAARFNLKNGDRNDFTGFRVVRDIGE